MTKVTITRQDPYYRMMNNHAVVGSAAAASGNITEARIILDEMTRIAESHGKELPTVYYKLQARIQPDE